LTTLSQLREFVASNEKRNECKTGRKQSRVVLNYYPMICLKELWKITKNLIQDIRLPDPTPNPVTTEYELHDNDVRRQMNLKFLITLSKT
jgi:hypothetical protein